MNALFADTVYYLALANPNDQYHTAAVSLSMSLKAPLVTTDWILTEIADGLSSSRQRATAVRLLELIRTDPNTEVIRSDAAPFEKGLALYTSRADKDWSLTDCVSFAMMTERGLTDALTADHHFEQAGFRALMRPGQD